MLIELTLGGVQYAGTVEPVTGPVPNPTPVPVPPPAPQPTPPPAPQSGWQVAINPLTVNPAPAGTIAGAPLDMSQARTFVFHCPANTIHAFRIVFDPASYPGIGAAITTNQIVVNPNRRDMAISDAPGKMIPIGNSFAGRVLNNAENAVIYVTFDAPVAGLLALEKNKEYWLNIKPTNPGEPMDYLLQPYPM